MERQGKTIEPHKVTFQSPHCPTPASPSLRGRLSGREGWKLPWELAAASWVSEHSAEGPKGRERRALQAHVCLHLALSPNASSRFQ